MKSIKKDESKSGAMDTLLHDCEKRNDWNEKLNGSAQLLDRPLPPVLGRFEFGLRFRESWDEYRHLKLWWPAYRKQIMVSSVVFIILLWQFFGLLHRVFCDGPATQAQPPIQVAGVPQFVLDYAPLVWLHENESYFPSDMLAQVTNSKPKDDNYEIISNAPNPLNLENLSDLNNWVTTNNLTNVTSASGNGTTVFLTSNDDVTMNPTWLNGVKPDTKTLATNNATSCAIIINDHDNGTVDAFYMYFYAYNQGNTVSIPLVFSREIGDHVGDWEHSMIRFVDQKPSAIWYSQHEFGASYSYDAVVSGGEVQGIRPYVYSAIGSHANYAVVGSHDHTVPDLPGASRGLLNDYTSRGYLWDPTRSAYFYNYNSSTNSFSALPVSGTEDSKAMSPLGAMDFKGQWGDMRYPDEDPRQEKTIGSFYKFESGPTGPQDKQLQRLDPCPDSYPCIVRTQIGP